MTLEIIPIPYLDNPIHYYQAISDLPYPVLLDSGAPHSNLGRYDILSAQPMVVLESKDDNTVIHQQDIQHISYEDPFELVKNFLGPKKQAHSDWPFTGGAIGYFAYDLGRRIENLPTIAQTSLPLPDMLIGIYDWAIVLDHHQQQAVITCHHHNQASQQQISDLLKKIQNPISPKEQSFKLTGKFESSFSKPEYQNAFNQVKDHIKAGDCYQINLTQRFTAPYQGSTWQAYQHLRQHNPAQFGAFLNYPEHTILSFSPERFLKVVDQQVETKPIKGTRPRDRNNPSRDKALAQELVNSEKDRAENLMIVDLLRNDLGHVCQPGTINVPKLFEIESFAAVHHLVSTVEGKLEANYDSLDLMRAAFPGGSITGAPKIRAMEIIESLEPVRRHVYCGSIAYIGFDRNMDSNIVIRTLTSHNNHLFASAGGGLVIDSQCDAEYQECFDKISVIMKVLNEY